MKPPRTTHRASKGHNSVKGKDSGDRRNGVDGIVHWIGSTVFASCGEAVNVDGILWANVEKTEKGKNNTKEDLHAVDDVLRQTLKVVAREGTESAKDQDNALESATATQTFRLTAAGNNHRAPLYAPFANWPTSEKTMFDNSG